MLNLKKKYDFLHIQDPYPVPGFTRIRLDQNTWIRIWIRNTDSNLLKYPAITFSA